MNVAIFSESPADDVALHILAQAVLGQPLATVQTFRQRAGGFGAVLTGIRRELAAAHYNTTATGLIIAVDADDTAPHLPAHEVPGGRVGACRACQLLDSVDQTIAHLRPVQGKPLIKTAIALAIPAMEAWYRCGLDNHATESRFIRDFNDGRSLSQARRELKRAVYGSERPSIVIETAGSQREAARLAADIGSLEARFPCGFGLFARMSPDGTFHSAVRYAFNRSVGCAAGGRCTGWRSGVAAAATGREIVPRGTMAGRGESARMNARVVRQYLRLFEGDGCRRPLARSGHASDTTKLPTEPPVTGLPRRSAADLSLSVTV
jgi:hypothetical protein